MHSLLKQTLFAAGAILLAGCAANREFFIAGKGPDGGIRRYAAFDAAGHDAVDEFPFTWLERRGNFFYGAGTFAPRRTAGVLAFAADAGGELRLLNALPSPDGKSYCHLTVSPNGKFLYAASYGGGAVDEFKLASDGSLKQLLKRSPHQGAGATARQKSPHPHFVGFTPDGKFLAVVDLGANKIVSYKFDPEKGIDAGHAVDSPILPRNAGPRHLVFAPHGRFAFVLDELDNAVRAMRCVDGRFEELQVLHPLPKEAKRPSYGGAIALSPDGRTLYLTHRGADLISVLRVEKNGHLKLLENVPAQGSFPSDLAILPGNILGVANLRSDRVNFFRIASDGRLTALPDSQGFTAPMRITR